MEACDDIAYSVLDAEDTIKKGFASYQDLRDFLMSQSGANDVIENVIKAVEAKNDAWKEQRNALHRQKLMNSVCKCSECMPPVH